MPWKYTGEHKNGLYLYINEKGTGKWMEHGVENVTESKEGIPFEELE